MIHVTRREAQLLALTTAAIAAMNDLVVFANDTANLDLLTAEQRAHLIDADYRLNSVECIFIHEDDQIGEYR